MNRPEEAKVGAAWTAAGLSLLGAGLANLKYQKVRKAVQNALILSGSVGTLYGMNLLELSCREANPLLDEKA